MSEKTEDPCLTCLCATESKLQQEIEYLKEALQKKTVRDESYMKIFLENCGFNVATVNRCLKQFREEEKISNS